MALTTCGSPLCPQFDSHIEAGSYRVAIEPRANLGLSYIPSKPIASLEDVHDSPIDGIENLRGRGLESVLWMHLTCLETHQNRRHNDMKPEYLQFPTLHQPLACRARLIYPESRLFNTTKRLLHLESPNIQTLYKWQGTVQLEKALAFEDNNEGFFINDDEDAAYLIETCSKFRGSIKGIKVETTGAQARGQLLSVLLRYIDSRKLTALSRKEAAVNKAHLEIATTVEREVTQLKEEERQEVECLRTAAGIALAGPTEQRSEIGQEEVEASNEAHIEGLEMNDWTLGRSDSTFPAMNDNLGDGLSEASFFHAPHQLPFWDDYLRKGSHAFRNAVESDPGSTEASTPEDESVEKAPSAAEDSSTESLRLVTPMVRFLQPDSEDTSSSSSDSPMQEVPLKDDDTFSEDCDSLDSWSDPDETLAAIGDNVGLATRIF